MDYITGDMVFGFIIGVIFTAVMISIAEALSVGDYNDTCSKESDCEDSREGLDVLPNCIPLVSEERREHNP